MKKLFLLDAYALIFRAYYAFIKNPRYNSKGQNTSAIYGFVNTLEEILNKEKPTHIAVAFDTKTPTFRKEIFKEYKANRSPTPEDIISAVPYIKDILQAYNIPVIETPGFEADDAIGTLAKKAAKEGYNVFMMTPDKDYQQLLEENIKMFKPRSRGNDNQIIGLAELEKKYKIKDPDQFIEILALWGDTSDNIPGVPGIGEKTAMKLINQFGSIDGIYKNIDKLKGKQKENLINFKEQLALSKFLVTIKLDVDVDFNEKEFELTKPNKDKLIELFTELEFRTKLNNIIKTTETKEVVKQQVSASGQINLFGMGEVTTKEPQKIFKTYKDFPVKYNLITTKEERAKLISHLLEQSEFCFDTETTNIKPSLAEIVGISFSCKELSASYIPFPKSQTETKAILEEFTPLFSNPEILKIGQNIKYDLEILKNYDIEVAGKLFDTMIAHYLLYPEQKHNLDQLAESYLNYKNISIETLIGKKGKHQGNMRNIAPERVKNYACEDADITLQLKNILQTELTIQQLDTLFNEIEMPLVKVLTDMEFTGVKLDSKFLQNYRSEIVDKIKAIETNIYKLSKGEFNISSPKQLGEVLFNRLNIKPKPKQTKTKQYSTAEDVLTKLKDDNEIIAFILEYRSLKKLLNTYIDALPELVNPKTERIHTSYNQEVTATGRLSSNNPNLQNIPIRTAEGREIRKAFIPSSDDNILIDADYSQVELRLMAHLSKDENMIEAFLSGEDIHSATAAKIFNVSLQDVSSEMRNKAKSANFAIIYGSSAFGLAQNLGIPTKEAKELIDGYFKTYPKVKEFMVKSIKDARDTEVVWTIKGRKRSLKNINSRNGLVRSNAERNAINAPIQGSAADLIKLAMINIFNRLNSEKLKSKMIMQVHDELTFDVPISESETIKNIIKEEMENVMQLSVPLTIDMSEGKNWNEAH